MPGTQRGGDCGVTPGMGVCHEQLDRGVPSRTGRSCGQWGWG